MQKGSCTAVILYSELTIVCTLCESALCFSAVPPSLDNAGGTEDMTVIKGSSTSMKCFTDGTPAPTVSWFKNGNPLSLGAHLTSSDQGMVLHFVKAEIGDTGKYTCVASNEAGDISKHFSLKVLGKVNLSAEQNASSK